MIDIRCNLGQLCQVSQVTLSHNIRGPIFQHCNHNVTDVSWLICSNYSNLKPANFVRSSFCFSSCNRRCVGSWFAKTPIIIIIKQLGIPHQHTVYVGDDLQWQLLYAITTQQLQWSTLTRFKLKNFACSRCDIHYLNLSKRKEWEAYSVTKGVLTLAAGQHMGPFGVWVLEPPPLPQPSWVFPALASVLWVFVVFAFWPFYRPWGVVLQTSWLFQVESVTTRI